ncbi:MAG: hypothetical protein LBR37_00445 [Erysipelotrichaceae bacterium]|jgi:hypothetical protein|nr:hypothetical protein [Erysipelotrichaceae bacterium]
MIKLIKNQVAGEEATTPLEEETSEVSEVVEDVVFEEVLPLAPKEYELTSLRKENESTFINQEGKMVRLLIRDFLL